MDFLVKNMAVVIIALVVAVLLLIIGSLEWRLRQLMRGQSGATLEEAIIAIGRETDKNHRKIGELITAIQNLDERARKNISRIETIRFTPFRGDGGNQSFATCFLDDTGDGVVISSLYSRDKVGIYAKPVHGLKSSYELTREEREAITRAATRTAKTNHQHTATNNEPAR